MPGKRSRQAKPQPPGKKVLTADLRMDDKNGAVFKTLPITLLSGFLGSGKTTLLSYILNSKDHGLKIAIVVNDMAAVNVDAGIVLADGRKKGRAAEKMIEMQNGCICCTLRGDFVVELAKMAKAGEYDYVLIESTGISEPQQVAESFTADFTKAMMGADGALDAFEVEDRKIFRQIADAGGLNKIARLDTTVTILDGFRFFEEFETIQLLHERFESEVETPEDERTVTDLLIDQVEFADVIIINKIDMIDDNVLRRIRGLVKTLNPGAKVLETSLRASKHSENPYGTKTLDVRDIIATGAYSEETSIKSSGWLRSIHEMTMVDNHGRMVMTPKPETLEYGINSFVYTARKPFHPARLFELVQDKFVILEPQDESEDEHEDEDEEPDDDDDEDPGSELDTNTNSDLDDDPETPRTHSSSPPATTSLPTRLHNKKAHPILAPLLRSKGFIWLATRPRISGDWSQAGAMLTISAGLPWFASLPDESAWPDASADVTALIRRDFVGEWGDRRQEIVFIGERLDVEGVTALFDACLLTDREMGRFKRIMRGERVQVALDRAWEDGWEDWDEPVEVEVQGQAGCGELGAGHRH